MIKKQHIDDKKSLKSITMSLKKCKIRSLCKILYKLRIISQAYYHNLIQRTYCVAFVRFKSLEIVFYVLIGVAPSVIVFKMVRLIIFQSVANPFPSLPIVFAHLAL